MDLITTYLIFSSITSILCYPTRPLDERAPELAWQAWLLVDDQNNQNRQNNNDPAGGYRRRITPKSVFIAPTFSPELLPPCADGYRSDTMGRCIKIIKLDESAHLNFILEKLNEKFAPDFGDYQDYEEEENVEKGPEKVNIPLTDDGPMVGDINDSTNIAIVVAPTNTNFPMNKLDKKQEIETTTEISTEETTLETTTTVEEISTSTESFDTTTTTTTSENDITTIFTTTDATTELPTTTDSETTTIPSTTSTPISLLSKPIRFPDDSETNRSFVRFPSDLETTTLKTTTMPTIVVTKRSNEQNNHRSRERNLFILPENWNQSSLLQQKPVVFRFSRKHTYVDTQQFNKQPDYYRTVPSDELSYIFGFKHKQNNINSSIR